MEKYFNFEYPSPIFVDCEFKTVEDIIEDGVIKAVANLGITVDYEELIKALNYERDMWHKGYEAGYQMGKEEAIEGKKYVVLTDE